jgi:hypothetical protein
MHFYIKIFIDEIPLLFVVCIGFFYFLRTTEANPFQRQLGISSKALRPRFHCFVATYAQVRTFGDEWSIYWRGRLSQKIRLSVAKGPTAFAAF